MGGQTFQGVTLEASIDDGTTYVAVGGLTGYNFEGGEITDIDVTDTDSTKMEYIDGLADADTATFDVNYSTVGNAGLINVEGAKGTVVKFRINYNNAATNVDNFDASVKNVSYAGAANDKMTGTISIRLTTDVART